MTAATETAVSTSHLSAAKRRIIRLVGLAGILGGVVMIIAGGAVWGTVSSQLAAEKITVAEDAAFLAGAPVIGPLSAYAEADIINHHALDMSEGLTYAELDREDPLRDTVMNASFLRTSLFTSVVSFGVAAFAIGLGLLVALFGWSIRSIVPAKV